MLILYPFVRGIFLSFTNLTEANQLTERCTKSITGGETCEPNPDRWSFVGIDNYVNVLTGRVGEFWPQFTVTIIWTVSCVVFHYGLGLGSGDAAEPAAARARALPGAADPAVGGAGVRQRLRLAVHVQPRVRAVQQRC